MPETKKTVNISGTEPGKSLRELLQLPFTAKLVLDFSEVQRLTTGDVESLLQIAGRGEPNKARIDIEHCNVDVYKVIKLTNLDAAFNVIG